MISIFLKWDCHCRVSRGAGLFKKKNWCTRKSGQIKSRLKAGCKEKYCCFTVVPRFLLPHFGFLGEMPLLLLLERSPHDGQNFQNCLKILNVSVQHETLIKVAYNLWNRFLFLLSQDHKVIGHPGICRSDSFLANKKAIMQPSKKTKLGEIAIASIAYQVHQRFACFHCLLFLSEWCMSVIKQILSSFGMKPWFKLLVSTEWDQAELYLQAQPPFSTQCSLLDSVVSFLQKAPLHIALASCFWICIQYDVR